MIVTTIYQWHRYVNLRERVRGAEAGSEGRQSVSFRCVAAVFQGLDQLSPIADRMGKAGSDQAKFPQGVGVGAADLFDAVAFPPGADTVVFMLMVAAVDPLNNAA